MLWKSEPAVAVFELVAGIIAYKAYKASLFTGSPGDYVVCGLLWVVAFNGLTSILGWFK